ncbi:hypothetical protein LINGRAHAP2_LOCUS36260 [Linum grandiflorum]
MAMLLGWWQSDKVRTSKGEKGAESRIANGGFSSRGGWLVNCTFGEKEAVEGHMDSVRFVQIDDRLVWTTVHGVSSSITQQ